MTKRDTRQRVPSNAAQRAEPTQQAKPTHQEAAPGLRPTADPGDSEPEGPSIVGQSGSQRIRVIAKNDTISARRFDIIRSLLDLEPGTPEWKAALRVAARRALRSERAIRRWLALYAEWGIVGLGIARPANAGDPRVSVSRAFDRAARKAGCTEEQLVEFGKGVDENLKALWASRAGGAGWRKIGRDCESLLQEAVEAQELELANEVIHISRKRVERFAEFVIVNTWRNDSKRFHDGLPRIQRDFTHLPPMELVVADTKHLDVIVRRADGTPAWPKMVAFLDLGTGRVFASLFLLNRREGITQEHVIEAFCKMVADPAWGLPRTLYLDNGPEYLGLDKIKPALNLLGEGGRRIIIKARPYNAAAKPIESLFSRLDRYVFSQIDGYAGGNRMAKQTQHLGKEPQPYPGTWDEFCGLCATLIADFQSNPLGGVWSDRSPLEWYSQKVRAGWASVTVDRLELEAAFSEKATRRVDRGVLHIGGADYTDAGFYQATSGTDPLATAKTDPPRLMVAPLAWASTRSGAPSARLA